MCLFLSGDMNIDILFRTFCASLRHVCFANYPLCKTVILNIIVEFERNTTFLFGLWADFAQVSIGQVSSNAPFWGAIDETVLDQVWLVNILDRTGIFPYRSGKRSASPTGPPPNFSIIRSRIARSVASSPWRSTSSKSSASDAISAVIRPS